MAKYSNAVLAVMIAAFGMGMAQAADRATVGHRDAVGFRMDRPQRPEMQTRDGDYYWCDESDGGLVCGATYCEESHYMSWCITHSTNQSREP